MNLEEIKRKIKKYLNDGAFDLAIESIKDGLEIDIFDSELYYHMGLAYEYKNELNKAYLCFENSFQYEKSEEKRNSILEIINELKEKKLVEVNNYSIVLLTYNNLEYTKKCINSIRETNKLNNYEIIIIDNNSTDDTPNWLKSQSNIKYILNDENKGFPAGCNQGIRLAEKSNDIFLLNNDTVIMPNAIFNLRMALYSEDNIGATGSVSNNVGYNQKIETKYDSLEEYYDYALKNNITNENKYNYRLKLVGFALLIKREVLEKVGMLDERFTPGNYEDDDISLRIIKSSYKNILCKDSFIFHYGSVSFGNDFNKYKQLLVTNQKKFKEKWGFNSGYSLNIRYDILNLIEEPKEKRINVLEIGCACGATLLEIKNIYPNSNVYGIELNENSSEIAESFAYVKAENVENHNLGYEEEFFDYIIFADVLEHLYNPQNVLENMKKYLKKNGYVLASIHNVLNFTVLRDLIDGKWTYNESGILDKTHIRFFTYKEIMHMFKRAKFNEISIGANTSKVENEEDMEFIKNICALSINENIESELRHYQYFVKAKNDYYINPKIERIQKIRKDFEELIKKLDLNTEDQDVLNELSKYIQNKDIDFNQVIRIVKKNAVKRVEILNSIAIKCYENQWEEYVIPLLMEAYTIDPRDLDTNYNLAYVLSMIGEYKLALEYLNKLDKTNENIENLKTDIGEKL